jgi:hypothetical protein
MQIDQQDANKPCQCSVCREVDAKFPSAVTVSTRPFRPRSQPPHGVVAWVVRLQLCRAHMFNECAHFESLPHDPPRLPACANTMRIMPEPCAMISDGRGWPAGRTRLLLLGILRAILMRPSSAIRSWWNAKIIRNPTQLADSFGLPSRRLQYHVMASLWVGPWQ